MIVLPGDAEETENPRLGWRNLVTAENIAASSNAAGFPALNMANPVTFELWRAATPGAASITVLFGGFEVVDYVGIARHNFGTAGIGYTLQGTEDGTTWADLDAAQAPVDDSIILHQFDQAELQGVRIVLGAGSAAAQAAVVHVGRITRVQRRLYVGHTPLPYGLQTTVSTGMSESGQYLGRTIVRRQYGSTAAFRNITPEFFREELAPFQRAAGQQAFFWAWRSLAYPSEVGYAWCTEDPTMENTRANGMVDFTIPMQGIIA